MKNKNGLQFNLGDNLILNVNNNHSVDLSVYVASFIVEEISIYNLI